MPRTALKDGRQTNLTLDGSTRAYLEEVAAQHTLSLAGAVRRIVQEHRVFFARSFTQVNTTSPGNTQETA